MSEFYRIRQKRVWQVDFELSVRINGDAYIRRVLKLRPEHVGWMTPGCGRVTEGDIEHRRYLVIDEQEHALLDHIISEEEGEAVMRSLRRIVTQNPSAQVKP